MDVWVLILLGILGLAAVIYSAVELFQNLFQVIAPDNADEAAIERRLGRDSPESRRAMARRFGGSRSYLKDGLTGLAGLAGLVVLYRIWFG